MCIREVTNKHFLNLFLNKPMYLCKEKFIKVLETPTQSLKSPSQTMLVTVYESCNVWTFNSFLRSFTRWKRETESHLMFGVLSNIDKYIRCLYKKTKLIAKNHRLSKCYEFNSLSKLSQTAHEVTDFKVSLPLTHTRL